MRKAERKAQELLEEFSITELPVPVESIAEKLGVTLSFEPFDGKDDVSGMLYRDEKRTVIGINSFHSKTRQRFSIAHEIGHLVLHKGSLYLDKAVMFRDEISSLATKTDEIQANSFAAEFLMPRTLLKVEISTLLSKSTSITAETMIDSLASAFSVSPQAMEFRLKNLGLLDQNYVRDE